MLNSMLLLYFQKVIYSTFWAVCDVHIKTFQTHICSFINKIVSIRVVKQNALL